MFAIAFPTVTACATNNGIAAGKPTLESVLVIDTPAFTKAVVNARSLFSAATTLRVSRAAASPSPNSNLVFSVSAALSASPFLAAFSFIFVNLI